MYELINEKFIEVKEYKGQRVVTFKDIDCVHRRPDGTARKRFNDNKNRLIIGVDYFVRNSDEAKKEFNIIAPNGLILLTESGYLMVVKSFTDDLAWKVQRQLVNAYFRSKKIQQQNNFLDIDRSSLITAVKELYEKNTELNNKINNLSKENHELNQQIQKLNSELNNNNLEFTTIIKILCEKIAKLYEKKYLRKS